MRLTMQKMLFFVSYLYLFSIERVFATSDSEIDVGFPVKKLEARQGAAVVSANQFVRRGYTACELEILNTYLKPADQIPQPLS